MQNLLEVHGLTRSYSGFTLDHISFSLASGSIMGLIGDNGAGKTTTLKLILNLIRRDEGEVILFGQDNRSAEREIKQQIGVVFDECHFSDLLRPDDLDRIHAAIYRGWDSAYYRQLLDRFSLPLRGTIKSFSRGMKMKLSFCCAMAHHPRLLLLDEATGGLDPVARNELLDLLLGFIQDEDRSVLLSSHITSDLERICDTVGYLHAGKMAFCEEKDALLERMGILHCGEDQLSSLEPDACLRVRRHQFGCDVLIDGREALSRQHPDWVVDRATLEDIMVFYAKGERR
ncbi:MAG: ABC transporter [Oscillospiraceae bacterium]|nr:MAG: ABC transporter [Oscillospiraceae bacterium]